MSNINELPLHNRLVALHKAEFSALKNFHVGVSQREAAERELAAIAAAHAFITGLADPVSVEREDVEAKTKTKTDEVKEEGGTQ